MSHWIVLVSGAFGHPAQNYRGFAALPRSEVSAESLRFSLFTEGMISAIVVLHLE